MRKLLAGILLAVFLPGLALAQTALSPPLITWRGQAATPAPVYILGFDTMSGLPCIPGATVTCSPVAGGGGPVTAAAGAYAAGAIVDIGSGASPAANTVNSNLVQLHTDNGAPGTGITQPTGGSGSFGWLSGIYKAVTIGPVPISAAASSVTGSVSAATITSTSTQYVAAASRKLLVIDNESSTASLACAFGATAALNTAGSFTIPPLNTRVWNSYPVPADAVNCISSAATSPATIEAN